MYTATGNSKLVYVHEHIFFFKTTGVNEPHIFQGIGTNLSICATFSPRMTYSIQYKQIFIKYILELLLEQELVIIIQFL